MSKLLTFAVSGNGSFPIDMLRYDQCWPATESDSHLIANTRMRTNHPNAYTVNLTTWRTRKHLTDQRWASFGWVID